MEKSYITRISFILFTRYYKGDEIKEGKMGRTRRAHGRHEECVQNVIQRT
jgi:hypothetical protein